MLAQWHLAGQAATSSTNLASWDYTSCLFKAQDKLISHYYTKFPGHPTTGADSGYMESIVEKCADDANMSFDEIAEIKISKGVALLWDSFGG